MEIQAVPDAEFQLIRNNWPWTSAKIDEDARVVDVDIFCRLTDSFDDCLELLRQLIGVLGAGAAALGVIKAIFWQLGPLVDAISSGAIGQLTAIEYEEAKVLFKEGVHKHWSRQVSGPLGKYKVNVRVREREQDALWYPFGRTPDIKTDSEIGQRSFAGATFWDKLPNVIFYDPTGLIRPTFKNWPGGEVDHVILSDSYRCTAAHEFGHAVLMASKGIWLSLTHKGTSTWNSKKFEDDRTPPYPTESDEEIDIMCYHRGQNPSPWDRHFDREQACDDDVTGLVALSVHPPWLPCIPQVQKQPDLKRGMSMLIEGGKDVVLSGGTHLFNLL